MLDKVTSNPREIQENDFLSFEYLKSLHDIEDMYQLIETRHWLKREELFKKVPQQITVTNNRDVVYDDYILLKIAIFYLEGIINKEIVDFIDYEIYRNEERDVSKLLSRYKAMCFSDQLKSKIKTVRKEKNRIINRFIEYWKLEKEIQEIISLTWLNKDNIFSKISLKLFDNSKFPFSQIVRKYLQHIKGASYEDLIDENFSIHSLRHYLRKIFSENARSFLLRNVARKVKQKTNTALQT